MVLRRSRSILLGLLLLLTAMPVAAVQRVDSLPPVQPFNAARFEIAFVINGQLFIAGKGEMSAPDRMHMVLKTLPSEFLEETTVEVVLYDGVVYVREDDDPQWYIEGDFGDVPTPPAGSEPIQEDLGDVPIHHMGSMSIAGTPTDQYQIWLSDLDLSQPSDYGKLDLWIGQAISYIYQLQVTLVTSDPDLGPVNMEVVFRFYDMESPTIVVGPPANAIPRDDVASLPNLSRHGSLGAFAAPLAIPQVREYARLQLGR